MTPSQAQRLLLRHRTPAQFFFGNAACVRISFVKMVQASTSKARVVRVSVLLLCSYATTVEVIHHGQEHLKSHSPPVALLET